MSIYNEPRVKDDTFRGDEEDMGRKDSRPKVLKIFKMVEERSEGYINGKGNLNDLIQSAFNSVS